MKKNTVLDWIFQQYVKNGLIIFLFHPFVFLLLAWLKNKVLIEINSKISFIIILFLAIPLISIIAKCFLWVGKIRIINKTQ
ncbi:MAG: hypothetical protein LBC89_02460 [Bacteroidales bacterium]|nr:hypothetical protein [Bacteroidales bacterium]